MIKTVVFDIGNVVWRFRPLFNRVFRLWSKDMGISLHQFRLHYYEKDALYCRFETNSLDLSDWLSTIVSADQVVQFIKIFDQTFSDQSDFQRYLNIRVLSLISRLQQTNVSVGCLTNTENFSYPYLEKTIYRLFDYQILSWQVGYRKPDPHIYHEIFKHGKFLPSEIIFIDDIPVNVATANKLGLHGILFTDLTHLKRDLRQFSLAI